MIGREDFLNQLKSVLPSECQAEIVALNSRSALTRFSRNRIHQNTEEDSQQAWLKVILPQGSAGVVLINSTQPGEMLRGLNHAKEQANPDVALTVPLNGSTGYKEMNLWDQATAEASPRNRAQMVAEMTNFGNKADLSLAGALETVVRELAIVNTQGLSAYNRDTLAVYHAVAGQRRDKISGYGYSCSRSLKELDLTTPTMEAAAKCQASLGPKPLQPGLYTVVLEPAAVARLLLMLSQLGFNGLAWLDGQSPFPDLGKKYLNEAITIWDDGLDNRGLGIPFDFQGTPKRRLNLVKEGIVQNVALDNYLASRADRTSTGYGRLPGESQAPVPQHLFWEPGNAMLDDMIATTKRGILITRFHHLDVLDPRQALITGTTRDGTLLIENGMLRGAITDLRIIQSLVKAFNQVELIGEETKLFALPWGSVRVPALKIRDFSIAGAGII